MSANAFSGFLQSVLPPRNNTEDPSNITAQIHPQIFESIIPGYGPIHNFILMTFGVDITILVTFFAAVWVIIKLGKYTWASIYNAITDYFMSSITVTSHDDIHEHMIKWLSAQPDLVSSRSLLAETHLKSAWDVDEDDVVDSTSSDGAVKLLNFSNQEAKSPPRFSPAFGSHRFWHNGTYFMLQRAVTTTIEAGNLAMSEKESLIISCFGRSPGPIKALLQDAKNFYHTDHDAKTVIRRPAAKEMRRHGSRYCWTSVASRPCRPMETVVLDATRKAEVLADINEYLHPATPRWYACRGIPYRRGYLFHGPPGTGKTSLSFALAGVFGLDIYVISLLESTLTEEDLSQLFNALPRRCVVLLEDIDTAGLMRLEDPKESDVKKNEVQISDTSQAEGWQKVSTDLAKALKKANHTAKEDEKKGISLSGLLNAIDGVASHEGRVLVMTTNKPESLDSALIRPGRVDLQVAFENASTTQVKELFERMYTSTSSKSKKPSTIASILPTLPKPIKQAPHLIDTPPSTPITSDSTNITAADTLIEAACGYPARSLEACAEEFASLIPDGKMSPAEVQGFLLKRKKDPQRACKEVGKWVEGVVGVKGWGGKVLGVQ